ncbi:MAG: carboxypeptidase regulatory-like domain-containing protein [Archangium sp.]
MRRWIIAAAIVALGLALVWGLSDDDSAQLDAAPRAQGSDELPPPVKPLGLNGARIAGTVLRDGKPVAKARVTLRAAAPLVTLSMDDGRFLFEDVPSGQLYLSASNAEAASEVLGPLQVVPGTKLEELVLNLAPAVNIEGRVIDLMTQRPIAKATVITPSRAGVTDDEGRFTVTGSKSQIWLDVSAPGFLTRTEWVSLELAQAGGKLEIVLTPSSRLEGKVTESGSPAVAATVWTEIAEGGRRGERSLLVFTDKEGNFSLECGAGAMQLTAVTARGTRVRGPFIRVAVGEKKTGIVLDAAEVSAAEGVVLLDGAPLPAAQITAIDAQTEELSGVATTTTEGKFRFESLALGKYVLQIRAAALTTTAGPFEHDGTGRAWQVNVQAGKALVGRVEPASAGTIVRWRSGTWSGPSAQTVTDAEGKFRFEGLPSENRFARRRRSCWRRDGACARGRRSGAGAQEVGGDRSPARRQGRPGDRRRVVGALARDGHHATAVGARARRRHAPRSAARPLGADAGSERPRAQRDGGHRRHRRGSADHAHPRSLAQHLRQGDRQEHRAAAPGRAHRGDQRRLRPCVSRHGAVRRAW